ncbi:MAG TPA: tripartite tricarboxylate transporter substrate binding protein [Ramlibacter sp.]|uniref:Bug family tripartite tricarboxylate transporter substrate binding protein n=1 Tax=Ramlibacter sp. TaxID=1917967 RepID=UPI002D7F2DC6|nr:tripartite tricarboxylate transporter substrate binding protein [Ramlibacter sp.]HET8744388.1 tripartite tricarboxylate transporter substrate binding protein [Ramlibacter sp.]
MKRHLFVRSLVAAVCAAGLMQALPAAAQNWPSRPVKIIVPFAVGGPADVFARALAQRLPDLLGQPFVVENKPGAGAVIGTDMVAKAPPDGYTLLLMSNTHTVNETLLANKPYELLRDFVPVAPINYSDLVLVAHPSVPVANVRELLQAAKAQPGKLTYASSGTGTPYHMAGELFKSMSGTSILHIPYKGSSGARTDILGGQVNFMFDAVTTMTEHIKAGKVKAIGTSGKHRSSVLPDVPTIDESGVPGYEATIWLGLLAPKGTPADVVNRLNGAVSKIVSDRELQQAWARQGAVPLVMDAQAFNKYVQDDIQKWAKVIHSANIKAD